MYPASQYSPTPQIPVARPHRCSVLLQRIIDNTDTKLLDEEISERRKAIHEFLMLNHTDEEVRE